jgi:hypothetical protein
MPKTHPAPKSQKAAKPAKHSEPGPSAKAAKKSKKAAEKPPAPDKHIKKKQPTEKKSASKAAKPAAKPAEPAAKPAAKAAKPSAKPARAEPPAKKRAAPEPEPEPETGPRMVSAATARSHKRLSGYRKLSKEAGYRTGTSPDACSGQDSFVSLLSLADAKRLATFFPVNVDEGSFDRDEAERRLSLAHESVSVANARVIQSQVEPLFRRAVNAAVLAAFEGGRTRVDASEMHSALREMAQGLFLTSTDAPPGLVRHAQKLGILGASEADAENAGAEKEENDEIAKMKEIAQERKLAAKLKRELARKEKGAVA